MGCAGDKGGSCEKGDVWGKEGGITGRSNEQCLWGWEQGMRVRGIGSVIRRKNREHGGGDEGGDGKKEGTGYGKGRRGGCSKRGAYGTKGKKGERM